EAVVAGRRRTIALRYVGPGRSRAQAPENPVQHLAIIHPWLAARLVRQQRLNDRPFKISDLVAASAHHISSFEELESHHPEPRYQFMSLRPRGFSQTRKSALDHKDKPDGALSLRSRGGLLARLARPKAPSPVPCRCDLLAAGDQILQIAAKLIQREAGAEKPPKRFC